LHNDGAVVHIPREFADGLVDYLNEVLGAFEGGADPSELSGKDLVCKLITELSNHAPTDGYR
jgi:hypothetical protein